MPKVNSLKKDADLERRMEELSKELEKLKEHLESSTKNWAHANPEIPG